MGHVKHNRSHYTIKLNSIPSNLTIIKPWFSASHHNTLVKLTNTINNSSFYGIRAFNYKTLNVFAVDTVKHDKTSWTYGSVWCLPTSSLLSHVPSLNGFTLCTRTDLTCNTIRTLTYRSSLNSLTDFYWYFVKRGHTAGVYFLNYGKRWRRRIT